MRLRLILMLAFSIILRAHGQNLAGLNTEQINKRLMEILCDGEDAQPTKCKCPDGSGLDIPAYLDDITDVLTKFRCNNSPPRSCSCSNGKSFLNPSQEEIANLMQTVKSQFTGSHNDPLYGGTITWTISSLTLVTAMFVGLFF